MLLQGIFRDTYAFRSPGIDTNHHKAGLDFTDYNLSETDLPKRRKHLLVSFIVFNNDDDVFVSHEICCQLM